MGTHKLRTGCPLLFTPKGPGKHPCLHQVSRAAAGRHPRAHPTCSLSSHHQEAFWLHPTPGPATWADGPTPACAWMAPWLKSRCQPTSTMDRQLLLKLLTPLKLAFMAPEVTMWTCKAHILRGEGRSKRSDKMAVVQPEQPRVYEDIQDYEAAKGLFDEVTYIHILCTHACIRLKQFNLQSP